MPWIRRAFSNVEIVKIVKVKVKDSCRRKSVAEDNCDKYVLRVE